MAAKFLDDSGLSRLWAKVKALIPNKTSQLTNDSGFITGSDIPEGAAASTTVPKMDGTASAGTEMAFARGDHIHPSDTSKVDKVSGKGLSTNDFTTTEKNKLAGIAENANNYTLPDATATVKGGVKVGTNIAVSGGTISVADASTTKKGVVQLNSAVNSTSATQAATPSAVKQAYDKASTADTNLTNHINDNVKHITAGERTAWNAKSNFSGDYNDLSNQPSIPNRTSQLTNDSDFQTSTQVAAAVANAGHLKRAKVAALPALADGDVNTIYMVRDSGASGDNVYVEWMKVESGTSGTYTWEVIGDSNVVLTDYWAKADLVAITDTEIDSVCV